MYLELVVLMSVFSAFFFCRVTKEKLERLEEMSVNQVLPYVIVSLVCFLTVCCLHPACSLSPPLPFHDPAFLDVIVLPSSFPPFVSPHEFPREACIIRSDLL